MEKTMDYSRLDRRQRTGRILRGAVIYTLLALWALLVLFPFYWMLLTSVKSYSAYSSERIPQFIALRPTLQNYIDAFTAVPLGRYFLNTVVFALGTTALMLAVARERLPKVTAEKEAAAAL